jgi:hypothetical protein
VADPIPATENLIVLPIISIVTGGVCVVADPTKPLDATTTLSKEIVSVEVLTPIYEPSFEISLL